MNAGLVIARLTLREAVRRRVALAALLLGLAFLAVYSLGLYFIQREMQFDPPATQLMRSQIWNFLSLAGLYAVTFLTQAMAALVSADTLAGEISSGAIQSVAAKPVPRALIVLGKWLGFALLLAGYVGLMGGGALLSQRLLVGYTPPQAAIGLSLIYMASLLMMSVTLLCSSVFSTLATGGVVFGLYGLGFIGGWVEQIGSILQNQTAVQIGIVTSLIFPSEALWRRAAYEMQSPLAGALGVSPFGAASIPSPLMVIYGAGYTLAMLALAMRAFSRRDL